MAELISIIIPSYNHGRFIGEAINSVLRQTYNNWEIIIVDNNSTDNTDQVLAKYNDTRIKIYKINNNGIIAKSRNLGIKLSKGQWVAFLDSDDWWVDSKLMTIANNLAQDYDILYHDSWIYYSDSNFFKKLKSRSARTPIDYDLIINGNFICNSSVILKKSILEKLGEISEDPLLVGAEDYNTWIRISKITNNFKYISKTLTYYRIHQNGISRKNMSDVTENAVNDFISNLNSTQLKYYNGRLNYINAKYFYDNGFFKKSLFYSNNAIFYGNCNVKIKAIYITVSSIINLLKYK